jgi:hypothetical protein
MTCCSCFVRQSLAIWWISKWVLTLQSFYLTCTIWLASLIFWILLWIVIPIQFFFFKLSVRSFVDDLFVPDIPEFFNFMYLNRDTVCGGIYPISCCELNYTSNDSSYNSLHLAISQDIKVKHWHFEKHSQPKYTGINMNLMSHVHPYISDFVKLYVLTLCSSKEPSYLS